MEAVVAVMAAMAIVAWSAIWVVVALAMLDLEWPRPVPVRVTRA